MKTIILRKILLIVSFLSVLIFSTGYSMEEHSTGEAIATPSNITFAKLTFPAEQEKLKTEITQGSSYIHIYIPYNHPYQYKQEAIDFQYNLLDLTNIKALIIEHSLGSERGYSKTAVNALIPFIKNAQNLEKITLSQALADDLLPCLRIGVYVLLDCSCVYCNNDTLYSKEYLMGIRNSLLAYYQEIYPKLRIGALEIQDPFAPFYK